MAKDGKAPKARRGSREPEADLVGAEWAIFEEEDEVERKFRRWAIGLAVAFHIFLLFWQWWPTFAMPTGQDEKDEKVYVVQQIEFKPPPPKPEQEIPKPKSKKVPIPDPTPDEPEPIRLAEEIDPEIDIPDTDAIFGVPDAPPPTEPTGPIRVGGDVRKPEKISGSDPQYTEVARRARVEGVVIVEAIIDKEGNVTNVKVLKGLPMGLDASAANAVKNWKFEPASLHGNPVAVYYTLTVNFQLN